MNENQPTNKRIDDFIKDRIKASMLKYAEKQVEPQLKIRMTKKEWKLKRAVTASNLVSSGQLVKSIKSHVEDKKNELVLHVVSEAFSPSGFEYSMSIDEAQNKGTSVRYSKTDDPLKTWALNKRLIWRRTYIDYYKPPDMATRYKHVARHDNTLSPDQISFLVRRMIKFGGIGYHRTHKKNRVYGYIRNKVIDGFNNYIQSHINNGG